MKRMLKRASERLRAATSRGRRPSENGSALMIAMLVVLAVTGLSLLAVQTAVFEARASSTYRNTNQAEGTARLGWGASTERIQCFGAEVGRIRTLTITEAADFSCGIAPAASLTGDVALGGNRTVGFNVTTSETYPGMRARGYDEDWFFYQMRVDSVGAVSETDAGVSTQIASSEYRGYVLAGPARGGN